MAMSCRAGERRISTRIAVWLLVALAVVNVPLTIQFALPGEWTHKPDKALTAAARGWPARTPHEKEWPAPTNHAVEHQFARTRREAWAVYQPDPSRVWARVTHKMVDERYGWPLACLRRTQRWWPDNEEWRIDAPWDTGMRLEWEGVVMNPVIGAASVWGVLFAPRCAWGFVVARRRRREGCCPGCGYPIGVSAVCTECGREVSGGAAGA